MVDVSKRLEVRETVRLMRKLGLPDVTILINNAAVLYHRPFLSCDADDVEKTFNVNVFSNFWVCAQKENRLHTYEKFISVKYEFTNMNIHKYEKFMNIVKVKEKQTLRCFGF